VSRTPRYHLCTPAINPDLAIVHCSGADAEGNAVFGGSVFSDWDMIRASKKVILMVEQEVGHSELVARAPSAKAVLTSRFVPGLFVSAVVPVFYGCHPTSSHGHYTQDIAHLEEYLDKARTSEGFNEYLGKYVTGVKDDEGYRKLIHARMEPLILADIKGQPGPGEVKAPVPTKYGPATVEIMVCSLARELSDQEVAIMGASSAIPLLACMLAKATHAPGLTYLSGGSGAANPTPDRIPLSSCDQDLLKAKAVLELGDLIDGQVLKGADIFFAGGLQVDRNGNLNLIGIGPHEEPRFRGPGTAGLSLFHRTRRIVIYMTGHTERQFVEKVDHVSGAGRPINNVVKLVSPLGVFDFDKDNRMRISTLHPGIKAKDVIKNTGFFIGEEKEYPVTELPSEMELGKIREIDPDGRIRDLI